MARLAAPHRETDDPTCDIHRALAHGGLSHLAALEAESIFIMREVAAEFERPVVLF